MRRPQLSSSRMSRLTSFERLEIYNRQYWFRIISAFAEDFPGLAAVVGQTAFDRLTRAYLAECPSQSFTLRNLGSQLEGWLENHPVYAGKKTALALDVVRLEWAYIEAFDNAEERALTLADMGQLDGSRSFCCSRTCVCCIWRTRWMILSSTCTGNRVHKA